MPTARIRPEEEAYTRHLTAQACRAPTTAEERLEVLQDKRNAVPCCVKFLVFLAVYCWCGILGALATVPLYSEAIEMHDHSRNATVTDWTSTYTLWISLPASWLLLTCCCCCVCCCCCCDEEQKPDGGDEEWAHGSTGLGWLVDVSKRFSEKLPRDSVAQRVTHRISRRIQRAERLTLRASARVSARVSARRSSARYSTPVRSFQGSAVSSAASASSAASSMRVSNVTAEPDGSPTSAAAAPEHPRVKSLAWGGAKTPGAVSPARRIATA